MKRLRELFTRPIDPTGHFQRQFRSRFAMTMIATGCVFLVVFAVVDYQAGMRMLAAADVVLAAALIAATAYMHISGQVEQAIRWSIASLLLWFVAAIPLSVLALIWFPVLPLAAFFGLGRREGLRWSVAFLLIVMTEYFICRQLGVPIANDIYLASTVACLALVILAVLFYQRLLELLQAAISQHNQRLLQTQRMESIGVLAGGVAHDFNNLLVGVLGNIELAMMELGKEHPVYSQLEGMLASTQRGVTLVKQLLSFAGKGGWESGPVDFNALLEEIRPGLESLLGSSGRLDVRPAARLPRIDADPAQLEQVMVNLVNNAAEAAFPGRSCAVTIRTGAQQGVPAHLAFDAIDPAARDHVFVYVQVEDNGRGIDSKIISHVFDPFFTTKNAGSGLGLAAVAGVVRSMSGAVEIDTRPDAGTVFTLWFPACEEEAVDALPESIPDSHAQLQGRVLLVEEEETFRRSARRELELMGLQVVVAESAQHALRILHRKGTRMDLLILDAALPDERMPSFLQHADPGTPVLISSRFSRPLAGAAMDGRRLAFVQKPFQPGELGRSVETVLAGQARM